MIVEAKMFKALFQRVVGRFSKNERIVKKLDYFVKQINKLEPSMEKLSDKELREKTEEFKERLAKGASLDSLLIEAFAVVREAAKRTIGQRHFDVQLKGGVVLHRGMVTEMKTGEGKTLVSTMPVYLNALTGKGVHIVTVNDYLAQRDAHEMGRIYNFLGLSVGCIIHDLTDDERRQAYGSDITYGTNNEFGFDYLRDNMKFHIEEMCQRPFNYAIVDEVDSILIDEARTPLIISGPAEESSDLYVKVNEIIPKLLPEDYEKEEKSKAISLTDKGCEHIEQLVKEAGLMKGDKLFDIPNTLLVHHINQALKAQLMFNRDIDYIVRVGKVEIVDEFTGRVLKGRRYSDGLHQALEAKEEVEIEVENQTLASITFQNYFLMYPKLAGMTGTAMTEATEFDSTYNLSVISIPTHQIMVRQDLDDEIFRTREEKANVIAKLLKECQERKQPVLMGTISIESSEYYSKILEKAGIAHSILNARNHQQEALIIARAGVPGNVTIATNMAGRGTDIQLGGNPNIEVARALEGIEDQKEREKIEKEVRANVGQSKALAIKAGGLYVIGTERHESRRIDNQLRGRSGRQGDPGKSKFFISLQDDLMRIFGPNLQLLDKWFQKMELKEDEPIKHPWITKSIEKSQGRVEAQHFDMRKHLLKYAEVLNSQRKAIYDKRLELMKADDLQEEIYTMVEETAGALVELYTDEKTLPDNWKVIPLQESLERIFNLKAPVKKWTAQENVTPELLKELIESEVTKSLKEKERKIGSEHMRYLEKALLLRTLDTVWKEHINLLEILRQGVHLQAYGQKDPLNVYKHEGFMLFKTMLAEWKEKILAFICHFSPEDKDASKEVTELMEEEAPDLSHLIYDHPEAPSVLMSGQEKEINEEEILKIKMEASGKKVKPSRNALCFCGSKRRYKHCHGRLDA